MKKDEILKMEAGREMDALVHTEVMDYHGAYRYEGAFGHERTRHVSEDCPHYSTDIASTWKVVEKMREEDFWFSGSFKEQFSDPGLIVTQEYEITFRCIRAGTRGYHTASAPTAPLAICRAALKAVGAE